MNRVTECLADFLGSISGSVEATNCLYDAIVELNGEVGLLQKKVQDLENELEKRQERE